MRQGVAAPPAAARPTLPFRAVNRAGSPQYDPALQRHHLLPWQLLEHRALRGMIEAIGRRQLGFDDFRSNGLLLPARDEAAMRLRLPLHRGPHRAYTALVVERAGQVEQGWAAQRARSPEQAAQDALARLRLLQRALRRRLLTQTPRPMQLNRHDPLGHGIDFAEMDAMVEALWAATDI